MAAGIVAGLLVGLIVPAGQGAPVLWVTVRAIGIIGGTDRAARRRPAGHHPPPAASALTAQASPASTIASVWNVSIRDASPANTACLAAFQLAIFAAPYM